MSFPAILPPSLLFSPGGCGAWAIGAPLLIVPIPGMLTMMLGVEEGGGAAETGAAGCGEEEEGRGGGDGRRGGEGEKGRGWWWQDE